MSFWNDGNHCLLRCYHALAAVERAEEKLPSERDQPLTLSRRTVETLWTKQHERGVCGIGNRGRYGVAWCVVPWDSSVDVSRRSSDRTASLKPSEGEPSDDFYVCHTGGAIGATSVLLLRPWKQNAVTDGQDYQGQPDKSCPTQTGVVVALLCNLENASGVEQIGLDLARLAEKLYRRQVDTSLSSLGDASPVLGMKDNHNRKKLPVLASADGLRVVDNEQWLQAASVNGDTSQDLDNGRLTFTSASELRDRMWDRKL